MLCLCLSIVHAGYPNYASNLIFNALLIPYLSAGMPINIYYDGVLMNEGLVVSRIIEDVIHSVFLVEFVSDPVPHISWGSTIGGINLNYWCAIGELANPSDNDNTNDDTNTGDDNTNNDTDVGDNTDNNISDDTSTHIDGDNYRRVSTWQLIFGAVGGVSVIVLLTLGVSALFNKIGSKNKRYDRHNGG